MRLISLCSSMMLAVAISVFGILLEQCILLPVELCTMHVRF